MRSLLKLCILILAPLLLIPVPLIYPSSIGKCAYVMMLISIFWVTETLHLSVTSLLPMVLLPLMGVIPSDRVAMHYFTNTSMLLMGGLILARAIEYRNLHKRIALFVLLKVGTNPMTLIFGFMLPTWFMSMWMSNVAATSMVIAIVEAVTRELQLNENGNQGSDNVFLVPGIDEEAQKGIKMIVVEREASTYDEGSPLIEEDKSRIASPIFDDNYAKAGLLCVAYSATCGGIGTLTGTTSNLIFYGLITSRYGDVSGINFGNYMVYAVPISFILLLVTWVWICLLFIGPKNMYLSRLSKEKREHIQRILRQENVKLGPMSFPEISCIVSLLILILLWVTRDPGYSLWGSWFEFKQNDESILSFATDTQPVIFVAIFLMTWPSQNPFVREYWSSTAKYEPLLPWQAMQSGVPWGVVFLLGGGLTLADACEVSGLSAFMGTQLSVMQSLPPFLMMFLMIIMISCITEITSNTATATIVLPLIMSLAECSFINPLFLSLPAVVSTSLAFCLPVSTAPNAIIFASGKVRIIDMVRCGMLLNATAIFIVYICTITYGTPLFHLNTFPSWANKCFVAPSNQTLLNRR